jgi:hypothetical protein
MSGTEHDVLLDLVPLVEVAAEASQQRHILTLAAALTRPSLYIQIPPGKAAYSSSLKRSAHDDTNWQTQQRVAEARRRDVSVIRNPTLRRDISFVALAPEDVRRLATAGVVHVQRFIGGVNAASAQGSPRYMPAALCLRPALEPVDSSLLILDSTAYAIRVELRDVLLDCSAMGLLADSADADLSTVITDGVANTGINQGELAVYVPFEDVPEEDQPLPPPLSMMETEGNDPFNLGSRAPGVFVLYSAAKHFFGSNHVDTSGQRAVANWIKNPSVSIRDWISTLPGDYKKLANEANSRLANKLIAPEYKDPKSRTPLIQPKPLSGDALGQAWKYRDGVPYISKRFSLVLLAVDFWQQLLCDDTAYAAGSIPVARLLKYVNMLFTEVGKYGFTSKEEMRAIVDFVIWPRYIPELEKLKAASQAPRRSAKKGR